MFLTGAMLFAAGHAAVAQDFLQLYRRVNPAVAVINTVERGASPAGGQVSFQGLGSGVLIDGTQVMTAAHVVQTADLVEVQFVTGEAIYANVIASDPSRDLALLELEREPMDIVPARLGDSDVADVGSQVFVVGAPLGLTHSLTVGYLSARRSGEAAGGTLADDVVILQTDAAINQGNSGGPMFNMDGEVIGIVSYIMSQSGGFEGLGFAIASNTARNVLLERNSFWSGISFVPITNDLARLLNLPTAAGFLVQNVALNSPAQRAGLRPSTVPANINGTELFLGGDIVLAVDDIAVSEPDARNRILERLSSLSSGSRITIDVLRLGQLQQLSYLHLD
jgi:S1-C subfamily serine protease